MEYQLTNLNEAQLSPNSTEFLQQTTGFHENLVLISPSQNQAQNYYQHNFQSPTDNEYAYQYSPYSDPSLIQNEYNYQSPMGNQNEE